MSTSGRDNHDDVEDRLRAALHHRARDFTASPDAWQRTLARRGDPTTRLRTARAGHRRWSGWIAPLAAAAAVVAIAAGLLIARGPAAPRPVPGVSLTPSASAPPAPLGLSPTHGPTPKGLRVPPACSQATYPPPAYSVTTVTRSSMPALATGWLQKAPAISGIVRVTVDYRGDRFTAYFWLTHHSGYPVALESRVTSLPSAQVDRGTVRWSGGPVFLPEIPAGQAEQMMGNGGDRLVSYGLGLASSQVASVTMTAGSRQPIPGLFGGSTPVPGVVFSGPGFPSRLWMAVYPATPLYDTLILRDSAGATIGHGSMQPEPAGTMCLPLASLNFQPPRGGYAYATGDSLPQVASVTAVLPDGSQVQGEFWGPLVQSYFWEWQVKFPVKDANLTVTLVFRDAAGRVLGHFTTIPGQNPFPVPR